MMCIVRFGHEVSDRELQLMNPQLAGVLARRELERSAEKQQDVCCLADELLAGFEKGWGERWSRHARALQIFHQGRRAAAAVFRLQ